MSSSVKASTSALVAPASGRIGGGRAVPGGDRIDALSSSHLVSTHGEGLRPDDSWRNINPDQGGHGGGGGAQQRNASANTIRFVLPLNGAEAEALQALAQPSGKVFLSLMTRGVGVYEANMRVFSGQQQRPGMMLNRAL